MGVFKPGRNVRRPSANRPGPGEPSPAAAGSFALPQDIGAAGADEFVHRRDPLPDQFEPALGLPGPPLFHRGVREQFVEAAVIAVEAQQFGVAALFDDFAAAHDDNAVDVADR